MSQTCVTNDGRVTTRRGTTRRRTDRGSDAAVSSYTTHTLQYTIICISLVILMTNCNEICDLIFQGTHVELDPIVWQVMNLVIKY